MSDFQVLTSAEVREFVSDYAPNNYLLEGEEFTPTYIELCMDLAIDIYNNEPPKSMTNRSTFPSKSLLLKGTLWQMYNGKALLLARNTMSYSDGGIQIPIEERSQLYSSLAAGYQAEWTAGVRTLKTHLNMQQGWGFVSSDQSRFPLW